ncbi:MAG: glycerol-3-phosphate acyltransferase [Chloroflexota bacterium]
MTTLLYVATAVIGYLLGSLPTGYLVGKLWGVDVRRHGSGRTGGTNVMRAAGGLAAALTVIGDAFKGLLAVGVGAVLVGSPAAKVLAGLAALAGHNWSIFLGWRGGAGAITNLGVMFGFSQTVVIGSMLVGLVALIAWRMASAATLTMAFAAFLGFVGLAIWAGFPWVYALYGFFATALITIALLPNIRRILEGTERRLELN